MAESSLDILQHEGERRGEVPGHSPDKQDFDAHLAFYKGALRITRIFIIFMVVLLSGMYFFLVR
jgi:hypothetical protein